MFLQPLFFYNFHTKMKLLNWTCAGLNTLIFKQFTYVSALVKLKTYILIILSFKFVYSSLTWFQLSTFLCMYVNHSLIIYRLFLIRSRALTLILFSFLTPPLPLFFFTQLPLLGDSSIMIAINHEYQKNDSDKPWWWWRQNSNPRLPCLMHDA